MLHIFCNFWGLPPNLIGILMEESQASEGSKSLFRLLVKKWLMAQEPVQLTSIMGENESNCSHDMKISFAVEGA